MIFIETDSKDAAFHFSVEEYIMRHFPFDGENESVMMIWQAHKCAMLGRNQVTEAEVDMKYAENEGLQIVRRSSGGGAIFTDVGTFLYTMILPNDENNTPESVRKTVAAPVIKALNQMGVPAVLEGRNDIHVNGKKIGGMAQYISRGRICTHGSLLYNEDLEKLTRALRADDEKIRSKALKSIRSRVTNIIEYISEDYSTDEFLLKLKEKLFKGEQIVKYNLTDDDLTEINRICSSRYNNPAWTYGRAPKFSYHNSKHFSGGRLEVFFDIEKGDVRKCAFRGDFLSVTSLDGLEDAFVGAKFNENVFRGILNGIALEPYLGSISADEFISCVF